ncbi:lambda-crystallin-like protein [Labeo rohita]|uniref:Lambda-crystallin-like protein n=1 Tax=Labeo rohita TaxID=84645 RepID=A0A498MAL2_LABRO|nr:lambda-crystallin-like protein [Labeo rohita]
MVFLSGGYKVQIYDNIPGQASGAITEIRKQLDELQQAKMLRGNLTAAEQLSLLSSHDDLQQALEGAFFVQECVFEDVEAKQTVFSEVENLVTESVILSSSTSCLMPSNVFSRVQNQTRCIISHPVNPPYYVRLVELVPHPETLPAVMDVAYSLMTDVGQAPVRLRKEIDGFALNRVQYAIIAECWRLVQDGVISVKDIDLVMSEGLGMRYAFIGMEDYLQRYKEGMKRVLNTFGPVPDFSGEPAARITKEICELIPAEHLPARRERRDQLLMELAKLKK